MDYQEVEDGWASPLLDDSDTESITQFEDVSRLLAECRAFRGRGRGRGHANILAGEMPVEPVGATSPSAVWGWPPQLDPDWGRPQVPSAPGRELYRSKL